MEGRFLYFEKFRLDVRSGELVKEGRTVRLPPQPTKFLLLLTRSPGALVSHEEIQKELWGEDTFVDFEQAVKKGAKQRASGARGRRRGAGVRGDGPPSGVSVHRSCSRSVSVSRTLGFSREGCALFLRS